MRLIIIVVGILIAIGTFVVVKNSIPQKQEAPVVVAAPTVPSVVVTPKVIVQEVPTVDIYTAKKDIPIGAIITQDMLDIQPYPQHLLLPDMVKNDPVHPIEIVKMIARTPFVKGEPIITTKLANDKDPSFLAASLDPGMRLVTIPVDAITGAGGFVFPGDRVDVIVAHDVALGGSAAPISSSFPGGKAPKKDPFTEILISNVRVLAVNQKAVSHSGEAAMLPTNVSLEVSQIDAQKLALVGNGNGRLSLALCSLKDAKEKDKDVAIEPVRPTGVNDLSVLTSSGEEISSGSVTVVRGVNSQSVDVNQP